MSTATASRPSTPLAPLRPLVEFYEQAYCTNAACEAQIQRDLIFRNLDRDDPSRRTLRAYCRHCERGYLVRQRLDNGLWRDEGQVKIAAGKDLKGIKRLADHVLNLQQND